MLYALVNGEKKHIRDVDKGTIGKDIWHPEYRVKACKGSYLEYWRYVDAKPCLPEGYENETEWHAAHKNSLRDEYVEVIMGENCEHRADICTKEEVIELQYSSISLEAAKDRTLFYHKHTGKRLIWIVNAYNSYAKGNIRTNRVAYDLYVDWKHAKKWVLDIARMTEDGMVFLDLSPIKDYVYLRIWFYRGVLYGRWVPKKKFFEDHLEKYSSCGYEEYINAFSEINLNDYK